MEMATMQTAFSAKLLAAAPGVISGLMLHGGQLRQVFFPMLGETRVVWRMAYCLTESEAILEAERLAHAVKLAASLDEREKERVAAKVDHWSDEFARATYMALMRALRFPPNTLTIGEAQRLLDSSKPKAKLRKLLAPSELMVIKKTLGIELEAN